ncbi:cysteine proteinase, partial [Calocera viscosa TUFC12733]
SRTDVLYPGLVNISGTYCFLNAVLQALASCVYLQPFLDRLQERAEELDVPTPVTDALRDILQTLNTPVRRYEAHRPTAIISALASSSQQNHNTLFLSREHQDAQELFQLLSSVLQEETSAVLQEARKDFGLKGLSAASRPAAGELYTPFEGLSANRRTCADCGYTEAVMHFPFDNITLALPPQASCGLEECLLDYTRVERLTDCVCRKCSMLATLRKLGQDTQRLGGGGEEGRSPSKKKRGRDAKRLEGRVREAIEGNRLEEDIKGVKMERVYSSSSSKQTMIARPPPILVLHVNRSTYFGSGYAGRNPCRVYFPELLDLTDFTTGGELNLQPNVSLSAPSSLRLHAAAARNTLVLYRLSSVVCHYGTHSYGHYVAFRRKPRDPSSGSKRYDPPALSCPLDCACEDCVTYGPVRDEYTGQYAGWMRTSDDAVEEVGLSALLRETSGTFMLFYERILLDRTTSQAQHEGRTQPVVMPKATAQGRILQSVQIPNGRPLANGKSDIARSESSMDIDSARGSSATPEPDDVSSGESTVVDALQRSTPGTAQA